jgi:hypothetical protein
MNPTPKSACACACACACGGLGAGDAATSACVSDMTWHCLPERVRACEGLGAGDAASSAVCPCVRAMGALLLGTSAGDAASSQIRLPVCVCVSSACRLPVGAGGLGTGKVVKVSFLPMSACGVPGRESGKARQWE